MKTVYDLPCETCKYHDVPNNQEPCYHCIDNAYFASVTSGNLSDSWCYEAAPSGNIEQTPV